MQGLIELFRALDATIYGYAALVVLAALNGLAPALAAHG